MVFWNESTPAHDNISRLRAEIGITGRDINTETKRLIAHSQQHGIPTRVVPYDDHCNTHAPSYPIVIIEHGTGKSLNPGMKTGRFYAPCATQETARDWLLNSMVPSRPQALHTRYPQVNGGWWNYSLHNN